MYPDGISIIILELPSSGYPGIYPYGISIIILDLPSSGYPGMYPDDSRIPPRPSNRTHCP